MTAGTAPAEACAKNIDGANDCGAQLGKSQDPGLGGEFPHVQGPAAPLSASTQPLLTTPLSYLGGGTDAQVQLRSENGLGPAAVPFAMDVHLQIKELRLKGGHHPRYQEARRPLRALA